MSTPASNRERQRIYSHNHYLANRETYLERAARWAALHPELSREQHRAARQRYYSRVGSTAKDQVRVLAWQKANPVRTALKNARWRATHPEQMAKIRRTWNETHPEALLQYKARRRMRESGAPSENIARSVVFARDSGVCGICGESVDSADFHVDHILPLVAGGSHTYSNVQLAHPHCNHVKSSKILKVTVHRTTC